MRILIAVGLIAAPVAVRAQTLEEAVAARKAGDPQAAATILAPIVRSQPGHADAQVQYGYALLALDRLAESKRAFEAALAAAPSYEDARIGLALVAERTGDPAEARRQLASVASDNREARPVRERLARTLSGYQLDADGSVSVLTGNQPNWTEGSVRLRVPLGPGRVLSTGVEGSRRFGRNDLYGEMRLDFRRNPSLAAYVLAGGTPGADFRPKAQLGVGGEVKLSRSPNPTIATADLRWASYPSGTIWTVAPGLQQYLAHGRAWLTGRWINTIAGGRRSSGWLARADLQASDRFRIYGGVADAPDTSEGLVIDTFSLFGGVSFDVTDRHTLRVSVARERRDIGADRTEIGIGTGIRF